MYTLFSKTLCVKVPAAPGGRATKLEGRTLEAISVDLSLGTMRGFEVTAGAKSRNDFWNSN